MLINGAVIENGDRSIKIAIRTPNVKVLRLRDAMHPGDAKTPVSLACYTAQMILMGDIEPDEGRRKLLVAIEQLSQVFKDHDSRELLAKATEGVAEDRIYATMRRLRDLLPREARLFALTQ